MIYTRASLQFDYSRWCAFSIFTSRRIAIVGERHFLDIAEWCGLIVQIIDFRLPESMGIPQSTVYSTIASIVKNTFRLSNVELTHMVIFEAMQYHVLEARLLSWPSLFLPVQYPIIDMYLTPCFQVDGND